jgi:hypothetical protein
MTDKCSENLPPRRLGLEWQILSFADLLQWNNFPDFPPTILVDVLRTVRSDWCFFAAGNFLRISFKNAICYRPVHFSIENV